MPTFFALYIKKFFTVRRCGPIW